MSLKAVHASPLLAILLLADCGGRAGSTTPSPGATTPQAASLTLSPSSLNFSGGVQQASVSVGSAMGPLSFSIADPSIVRVTATSSNAFTVTQLAGGSTTVKVSDATGASGTLSVSTFICVPPAPPLDLVYPAYGSSNVPLSATNIWFGIYDTTNAVDATIPDYYVYLIASDGSTIQGQNLVLNTAAPPPGSTPPPSGYTFTYYTSAISGLKAGLTYKVQLVDPKELCLPPDVPGSFST